MVATRYVVRDLHETVADQPLPTGPSPAQYNAAAKTCNATRGEARPQAIICAQWTQYPRAYETIFCLLKKNLNMKQKSRSTYRIC